MDFELHERLAADCVHLGDLKLCRVLLMNESRYPWCILVPRRPNIREVHELGAEDQARLWGELSVFSREMQAVFRADKMNLAALGNMVPQLHVHLIARYKDDPAWPAPVWGKFEPHPYEAAALEHVRAQIAPVLETVGAET